MIKPLLVLWICLLMTACSTHEPPQTTAPESSPDEPQETPTDPVPPSILAFELSVDGLMVTLSASSEPGTEDIVNVTVSWGDGQIDKINSNFEIMSLTHNYTDPGIYQVTLEITDGNLVNTETRIVTVTAPEPIGEKVRVTFERIQIGRLLDCQLFGVFSDVQLSGKLNLNGSDVWSMTEQTTASFESLELDLSAEIDILYGEDAFVEIAGELVHALNPLEKIDTWSVRLPLSDGLYKSYITDDGSDPRSDYCYAGLYYHIERAGFLF